MVGAGGLRLKVLAVNACMRLWRGPNVRLHTHPSHPLQIWVVWLVYATHKASQPGCASENTGVGGVSNLSLGSNNNTSSVLPVVI